MGITIDDREERSGYKGHHHARSYNVMKKDSGAKDEEYGKDAAKREKEDIEAEYDEQWGHDDEVEENEDDNQEGQGVLGKGCGEEDNDEQVGFVYRGRYARSNREHGRHRRKEMPRNFPPPLPSLARSRNIPCQIPWVHLRSCKSSGRLVMKEVKIQHHEFFHAVRSNGRLILHLVNHDADANPSSTS